MSRSYKKTPIIGNTGVSDKSYKQYINRKKRRRAKQLIHLELFDELTVNLPFDDWVSNKDGKHCFINLKFTDLKFYGELMRK